MAVGCGRLSRQNKPYSSIQSPILGTYNGNFSLPVPYIEIDIIYLLHLIQTPFLINFNAQIRLLHYYIAESSSAAKLPIKTASSPSTHRSCHKQTTSDSCGKQGPYREPRAFCSHAAAEFSTHRKGYNVLAPCKTNLPA